MKYAITGPRGRILKVLDEANDRTVEIADEQAALVAAAEPPNGYFVIDGELKTAAEAREIFKAESQAARVAAMTPEELAAHKASQQGQAVFDAAGAVFESLPLGKQALWEPVRTKVGEKIRQGDFAGAVEIIQTVPTLYNGMDTDRAMFLALFS